MDGILFKRLTGFLNSPGRRLGTGRWAEERRHDGRSPMTEVDDPEPDAPQPRRSWLQDIEGFRRAVRAWRAARGIPDPVESRTFGPWGEGPPPRQPCVGCGGEAYGWSHAEFGWLCSGCDPYKQFDVPFTEIRDRDGRVTHRIIYRKP